MPLYRMAVLLQILARSFVKFAFFAIPIASRSIAIASCGRFWSPVCMPACLAHLPFRLVHGSSRSICTMLWHNNRPNQDDCPGKVSPRFSMVRTLAESAFSRDKSSQQAIPPAFPGTLPIYIQCSCRNDHEQEHGFM